MRRHHIEIRIYDDDGDLIKMSSSSVPGDYQLSDSDRNYLDWLEQRRGKRTIIEDDTDHAKDS